MIGTVATPTSILQALDRIRAGAASAHRSVADVTVSVRVDVSVDDDPRVARDRLRGFVAGILSASHPDRGFIENAGVEVPAELEAICSTKDLRLAWQSGHLVPDELVDALAWAGTASGVAECVAAAIEVGVDNVTLMFHPQAGVPAEQLDRFARDVIPRVAALRGVADLGPKGEG
jgi:alkanesulfonate monooxygenase SsuD/methylene tetrahydromethanopterin reductase-like flavin-dependent oxidoreductase (luciferase family)